MYFSPPWGKSWKCNFSPPTEFQKHQENSRTVQGKKVFLVFTTKWVEAPSYQGKSGEVTKKFRRHKGAREGKSVFQSQPLEYILFLDNLHFFVTPNQRDQIIINIKCNKPMINPRKTSLVAVQVNIISHQKKKEFDTNTHVKKTKTAWFCVCFLLSFVGFHPHCQDGMCYKDSRLFLLSASLGVSHTHLFSGNSVFTKQFRGNYTQLKTVRFLAKGPKWRFTWCWWEIHDCIFLK